MADAALSTGAPAVRPLRPSSGYPILQISPTDPLRLARTIPLSMWPAHVRDQLERRRKGMELALRRLEDLREPLVDKLDALTIDADLEPSLGMRELPVSAWATASVHYQLSTGATDDRKADGDGEWWEKNTDSDFEPSLGSPEAGTPRRTFSSKRRAKRDSYRHNTQFGLDQRRWARGCSEGEEEASLASADGAAVVLDANLLVHVAFGWLLHDVDLEEQCEGGEDSDPEPDVDHEPSLGSLDQPDQARWSQHLDDKALWVGMDAEEEHDGREPQCEDEGTQCDDEGALQYEEVPDYVSHHDQSRVHNPCGCSPDQRLREMR